MCAFNQAIAEENIVISNSVSTWTNEQTEKKIYRYQELTSEIKETATITKTANNCRQKPKIDYKRTREKNQNEVNSSHGKKQNTKNENSIGKINEHQNRYNSDIECTVTTLDDSHCEKKTSKTIYFSSLRIVCSFVQLNWLHSTTKINREKKIYK